MKDDRDEYEDIFSGRNDDGDEYEDVYSGRDESSDRKYDNIYSKEKPHSSQNYGGERYVPDASFDNDFEDVYSERNLRHSRASSGGNNGGGNRNNRSGKKKNGKKTAKRVIAILLVLILALAGIGVYLGYGLVNKVNYVPSKHTNVYLNEKSLVSNKKVMNILFIGCDDSSGGTSRSDSMMLISIDKIHKKMKLTSFMRDMWVYIPDNGYAKLNAAYSYGGAGLLMDTIEYNFGIKIDNYALVDFKIFSSIIDELGGVTVNVTAKEAKFINTTTRQRVKSGNTTLNGDEALVYCRIRHLDSDFMRTKRQRKVMSAIVSKAKSSDPITLYKLANVILPQVQTDITKAEMSLLGINSLQYFTYDVKQLRIPVDGSYTDKYFGSQEALSIDFDTNKEKLISFIYEGEN